jgi:hypothetical protein
MISFRDLASADYLGWQELDLDLIKPIQPTKTLWGHQGAFNYQSDQRLAIHD